MGLLVRALDGIGEVGLLGFNDRKELGIEVNGSVVCCVLGDTDLIKVGAPEGCIDGFTEGTMVGTSVDSSDGAFVGNILGADGRATVGPTNGFANGEIFGIAEIGVESPIGFSIGL